MSVLFKASDSRTKAERRGPGGSLFNFRWMGRIGPVHAALDLFADDERAAAGAVVSAGAVVADPAAELGEDHHNNVVSGIMLTQVVEEIGDGPGYLAP